MLLTHYWGRGAWGKRTVSVDSTSVLELWYIFYYHIIDNFICARKWTSRSLNTSRIKNNIIMLVFLTLQLFTLPGHITSVCIVGIYGSRTNLPILLLEAENRQIISVSKSYVSLRITDRIQVQDRITIPEIQRTSSPTTVSDHSTQQLHTENELSWRKIFSLLLTVGLIFALSTPFQGMK